MYSPPTSPAPGSGPVYATTSTPRPNSAIARPARSSSRLSLGSRHGISMIASGSGGSGGGGGSNNSKVSDEDSARTSVKVAVRVRPPLRSSDAGYDAIPQRFQKSMVQVTSPTSVAIDSTQGKKLFVFDRVFGPNIDQDGVWEYLGESVNAFLQGYNVSVLAYGQSGAGKSYTMGTSGPSEQADPKIKGVIPRAATEIFEKLSPVKDVKLQNARNSIRYSTPVHSTSQASLAGDRGWTMRVSYVEIYNEHLRDLLLPESTPTSERPPVTIREDTKGRILLTGLQEVQISSIEDFMSALNFGSSIRQTDATAINAKSSRSHAVFTVYLVQRRQRNVSAIDLGEKRYSVPIDMYAPSEATVTIESKLHFVDLAGSERLKNTGAQGDRAKEGISINAGLASLGKVISQLSSRHLGAHVSYRDSKLTRLLQDSLGGNAVTYMVACVTPVEFHLSETLNTVQYAQRARAIQSKPKIQELPAEGDLKALVERLRAEISFLRDQIRSSERGHESSNKSFAERNERTHENEVNLQNQLLDLQENYGALSQRHAKLISEIAKAREDEKSLQQPQELTNSAVERLARSNSFAEAVEQVVLEYEKTIQSLETSLSSTRSTLASTESSLLEHETKFAYMETINTQLQNRVQKLLDRELNTETYLNDLEDRLDGQSNGEERNITIIAELRKELSRVRENESSCEDYISTLEERLAEADQSIDTMQRETNKLQTIIERQRSLGKLDHLLHDLDSLAQEKDTSILTNTSLASAPEQEHELTGHTTDKTNESQADYESMHDDERSHLRGEEASKQAKSMPDFKLPIDPVAKVSEHNEIASNAARESVNPEAQESAAMKILGNKLEDVTQELMDLKLEHEMILQDNMDLTTRFEEAIKDLEMLKRGELAPDGSISKTIGDSELSKHQVEKSVSVNESEEEVQVSSTQTLSSELLHAGVDSSSLSTRGSLAIYDSRLTSRISDSIYSQDERDENFRKLQDAHARLVEEHDITLNLVEELRNNINRGRLNGVISPSGNQILRRKSSQNLILLDRANRNFKNIRNLAMQYLEGHENAVEMFDANFSGALHELQTRSDRILELEAEITGLRKDMEVKAAMITGLARERSSINNSPFDISVVATLQDRLARNETDMQILHKKNVIREQELLREIRSLREQVERSQSVQRIQNFEKEDHGTNDMSNGFDGPPKHKEVLAFNSNPSKSSESPVSFEDIKKEVAYQKTKNIVQLEQLSVLEKTLTDTLEKLRVTEDEVESLRIEKHNLEDTTPIMEALISRHTATISQQHEALVELKGLHITTQKDLEMFIRKERKQAEMIDELEQQLATTYDQHQETSKKLELLEIELETAQKDRNNLAEQSQQAAKDAKTLTENLMAEVSALQVKFGDSRQDSSSVNAVNSRTQRSNSVTSMNLRKSASTASLPSPPPAIPLPPLPGPSVTLSGSHSQSAHVMTPTISRRPSKDYVVTHIDDQDARIKTLEKQLQAEKALTATLEEALTDCEKTMKKLSQDKEALQIKANQAQQELSRTKNESQTSRYSMQAVEDERLARLRAEKAKEALEERMQALSNKKKSRSYACF